MGATPRWEANAASVRNLVMLPGVIEELGHDEITDAVRGGQFGPRGGHRGGDRGCGRGDAPVQAEQLAEKFDGDLAQRATEVIARPDSA